MASPGETTLPLSAIVMPFSKPGAFPGSAQTGHLKLELRVWQRGSATESTLQTTGPLRLKRPRAEQTVVACVSVLTDQQFRGRRHSKSSEINMENAQIGWIAAIIIGGLAGWLAEMFMKSNMGVLMNVILGIVGAIVANFLLSLFGVALGGWLGYLIAGFIGACILIALARMLRRTA